MAAKHLEAVVKKAISSAEFRAKLVSDPEGALRDLKIRPDKRKVAALKQLPHSDLRKLARAFGHKSRDLVN